MTTKEKPYIAVDAAFNFGKYKGRAVSVICHEDPSYIMWLRESGYRLDDELSKVAEDFANKNPAALKKLRDRIGTASATPHPTATTTAAMVDKVERREDALWGCW